MKKSDLYWGISFLLAGAVSLAAALSVETGLGGILFGLAGAGLVSGLGAVCRYVYWSAPENEGRYRQRIENEKIEMQDELKEKLRDKAGRHAYGLGLLVTCAAMLLFSVLGAAGLLEGSKTIVLYLGGYLVFQIVTGKVLFDRLLKKYE